MTDKEIVTALNCCASGACAECPRVNNPVNVLMCQGDLICEALDLINRQQADNERLKKLLAEADTAYNKCAKRFYKEGVKDFAEIFLKKVHDNHYVLVDRINSKDYGMFTIGIEQAVDETKKEMVGDNDETN